MTAPMKRPHVRHATSPQQASERSAGAGSRLRVLPWAADDGPRRDHRERRAALDPARTALFPGNLTWVINGYLVTFGGLLLLAGRMGDLVDEEGLLDGPRDVHRGVDRLRVGPESGELIVARLLQGVGGGVASSVILAIIVTEFPRRAEQAKAMGMYAFVSAGGGSIGLLAGGALTQSLDWHWIFFVNVPIGVSRSCSDRLLIEENEGIGLRRRRRRPSARS